MPTGDHIRIDLDDILRKFADNRGGEMRVELIADRIDRLALIQAMDGAVGEANEVMPDDVQGMSTDITVAGGSVKLKYVSTVELLQAWLVAFADDLGGSGVRGLLHATPSVRMPRWFDELEIPRLTAFLAFDGVFAYSNWATTTESDEDSATASRAQWCGRAVRWAAQTGGVAYLTSGANHFEDLSDEVAVHVSLALRVGGRGTITYAHAQVERAMHASFEQDGQVVYQVYDAAVPMTTSVDRIREALIANSAQTRLGFVATNPLWARSWQDRSRIPPPLPAITASALAHNNPSWHRFIPDVHGMQLLTEEHLSNTADLSKWNVTEVVAGRYLVEAINLPQWFSSTGPSESVLAKARADFGRAIISPDELT